MPSKKKKYNARFPAGRIKKIMQSDEEVGKVAQAVPIIISKTLELFVESLLEKSLRITYSRNAKTLSPSHMKQCIMAESRFDFLRELVKNIPDISVAEETAHDNSPGPPPTLSPNDTPYDLSMPSTSSGGHHTSSIQASPSSACTTITSTNTNGNANALRNGRPPPINSPIPPVQRSTSVPSVSRSDRKRSFEQQSSESPGRYSANFYKESSIIQHTSDVEALASKMRRTDSEPTPYTINLSATNNPIRRLQHQSKSIPCTSKEIQLSHSPRQSQLPVSLLQSSLHQSSYQPHSYAAQPQILTPAPIINVDICSKPIVKIDYSNLALPDKETTDCTRKENKSLNSLASACISPVINIDLSNFQNVVKDDVAKSKTSLELDEDYDNI